MTLTLLFGGARSGKSSLAVEMGRRFTGPVTYVATAPPAMVAAATVTGVDDDLVNRIERHRAERPDDWTTIEEQTDLEGTLSSIPSGMVIVDCLTLWTSNLMWDGRGDAHIRERAKGAAAVAAQHADPVVVISNEVGLGIHPESDLARRYRDTLGWVNQEWARASTTSLFLVAGRALLLDDPWIHLTDNITRTTDTS